MTDYGKTYREATKRALPPHAKELDHWFSTIARGEQLPPRSVQAVQAGLVAHALVDAQVDPPHFHYYHWVIDHCLGGTAAVHELSAQLIGMAFTSANVFATALPQPLTLNPWQISKMQDWPLAATRAVIIENNGVFIWLHHLHPDWPLIDQGGNDFQPAYLELLSKMVAQGLAVTYLGDLDATGIRMADTLRQNLPKTPEFLALQTPRNVLRWLMEVGKSDPKRTRRQPVRDPDLAQEMDSVSTQGKFVEQEQLLTEYETLIAEWLVN